MIRLLGRQTSGNVQKVIFLLEEIQKPYRREDYGRQFNNTTTPEYKAMNPNAKVPTLVDGATVFDLTVPDVAGSYGALPGCPAAICLSTSFDIDTGGPAGIVSVEVFAAVPEPASAGLLAAALAALAALRRAGVRGIG